MFSTDASSERATSIEDYQNTCNEFITDISRDYMDWVDRYQLGEQETMKRKEAIKNIVRTSTEWITNYGTTIKKIDIVMNDGVNKMAENTAGYPFKFDVYVNELNRYTIYPAGDQIRMNVKATPRAGRLIRIANYHKDQLLLVNSSSQVGFALSNESMKPSDILNDYILIDSKSCKKDDIISITVVVEEVEGHHSTESRGYSTIIRLV
jgi:hypothetical protein